VLKRIGLALLILIIVGVAAFAALAWRPAIDPIDPPAADSFDPALVQRGEQLAAVGNCIACHTVPGQKAFAGGLALPTPFGTIYSTNITPDPETGIGRWSDEAFLRAMHEGVDRSGRHLYPAFPYDHFTRVTDDDDRALYAYLMTREPVQGETPEHDLAFPYNIRALLAGWKLLYFDEGEFRPNPEESEEWNRGAYLPEGLGHCGGCHTPRNAMGAEDPDRHYEGGEAEGWVGYAIDESSPAPVPWDAESLAFYLRHGWHEHHGVSRGPMAEVTGNLAALPDEDVQAIAVYIASVMGEPTAEEQAAADRLIEQLSGRAGIRAPTSDSMAAPIIQASAETDGEASGEAIYRSACAPCHEGSRPLPYGGLHFSLSTAIRAPNPQNIINVTLFGLPAADGEASSVMPGFAGALTDEEIAALLAYLREEFSDRPAWEGVAEQVGRTRSGEYKVTVRPSDGIERAPINVGAEE
jgi:mono/diheme cytochrome c family protein